MRQNSSHLSDALNAIMFSLQRMQNRRITYAAMADMLGISQRAFSEWMRGAREPAAMEALLKMLSMLSNEEVVRILDIWRERSGVEQPFGSKATTRKSSSSAKLAKKATKDELRNN
jgi:transcriptional regulator with XRE-family HTH domain